jgi:hypothetical protein
MSILTQESLIKMCHLQMKPQQNGTGKGVVYEDFDSKGPSDLFDDYNDVSNFDTPSMSTNNENIQGRSEE